MRGMRAGAVCTPARSSGPCHDRNCAPSGCCPYVLAGGLLGRRPLTGAAGVPRATSRSPGCMPYRATCTRTAGEPTACCGDPLACRVPWVRIGAVFLLVPIFHWGRRPSPGHRLEVLPLPRSVRRLPRRLVSGQRVDCHLRTASCSPVRCVRTVSCLHEAASRVIAFPLRTACMRSGDTRPRRRQGAGPARRVLEDGWSFRRMPSALPPRRCAFGLDAGRPRRGAVPRIRGTRSWSIGPTAA